MNTIAPIQPAVEPAGFGQGSVFRASQLVTAPAIIKPNIITANIPNMRKEMFPAVHLFPLFSVMIINYQKPKGEVALF